MSLNINHELVSSLMQKYGISPDGKDMTFVSVRALISEMEQITGIKFIRMEVGIPGLAPSSVAIAGEKNALDSGVAGKYPPFDGIPALRNEIARFVHLFAGVSVESSCCFPVSGGVSGSFYSFMVAGRLYKKKNTVLLIDPGFQVHKQQLQMLGMQHAQFDVYKYRGEALRNKLDNMLSQGNICALLYSNPNNPAWICFTESELQIIAEVADKYNVVVIEDLAYFGMDFRYNYSQGGVAPYQPTIARYTNNYILLISSSKSFGYAGQRIGMMVISPVLYKRRYKQLLRYYPTDVFGESIGANTITCATGGVTHSAQYGLLALLQAVNNGEYDFISSVREYGTRAKAMKKIFIENGFSIVYDTDIDKPIADGFYFTVSYPTFTGETLVRELLFYGISCIPLSMSGSERTEGVRICVSLVTLDQLSDLTERLQLFHRKHKI